jgi:uncharacterized membrane protein
MNWNDYEAVWKRQELPVGANADLANLRETFETKRRKMAATLFLRDILEASAGVAVSIALAFTWWQQKTAGWPIALAIILTLGVTGVFIKERIRTRRNRLRPDASLLAKLEADITELSHQRRLLLNVWKWYLAPLAAAIAIVVATISYNRAPWQRDPVFLGCYGLFCALLFWGVWALNRQAVRKQIDPRLAELEKLRRDILTAE